MLYRGRQVPVDPSSMKPAGENDASVERALDDPDSNPASPNAAFDTLDTSGFDDHRPAGGHGRCSTIPTARRWRSGGPTSMGRQGPSPLSATVLRVVGARGADGTPLVAGRRVAAFTTAKSGRWP